MRRILKYIQTLLNLPFYKLRKNKIDLTSEIGRHTHLRGCQIGKWCHIGPRGNINNAVIGNYTCIAPSCQIGGMEHPYWDLSISPLLSDKYVFGKQTIIGHDVWIAADCIIRQGIIIGDGAVVGANSFVNKDVPPYAIVVGSPARILKYRFDESTIAELETTRYWENKPKRARSMLSKIKIQASLASSNNP